MNKVQEHWKMLWIFHQADKTNEILKNQTQSWTQFLKVKFKSWWTELNSWEANCISEKRWALVASVIPISWCFLWLGRVRRLLSNRDPWPYKGNCFASMLLPWPQWTVTVTFECHRPKSKPIVTIIRTLCYGLARDQSLIRMAQYPMPQVCGDSHANNKKKKNNSIS